MTDISKFVPTDSKTVEAIYALHKKEGDEEEQRGYLGASIIGAPCERYLWFSFRHCCRSSFNGRMYRLVETGDLAESRFVKELRAIGVTVHETDEHGGQWAVLAVGGHFSGHMDGAGLGICEAPKTWHVLEFKTHNNKSFNELKKEGVKKSKPQHYSQVQIYMHLTGMKRALYLAVNKDTEELYSERIRYNEAEAKALMDRAERIITSYAPPERIANRRDYYLCNWCDAQDICWGSEAVALPVPSLSCRQCCHATPEMDGIARWSCSKHGRSLSYADQCKTCEDHLILPGLITFVEPFVYSKDEQGNDQIEFKNANGETWLHGRSQRNLSSRDLMSLPANLTTDPMLAAARDVFDITIVNIEDNIAGRYTDETSRLVWSGKPEEVFAAWSDLYADDLLTLEKASKCCNEFYRAVEAEGERAAFIFTDSDNSKPDWAEIRVGIEK